VPARCCYLAHSPYQAYKNRSGLSPPCVAYPHVIHQLSLWGRYCNVSLIALPASSTDGSLGHLWKTGFTEGDLKTPLFDDVVPTLEAWKKAGRKLAIFSSGSVQAQLQFFSYVKDGETTRDVKPLFSAHYDTVNAGPKLEKASYEKICSELGYDASKVAFLTDNVKGKKHCRRIRPFSCMLSFRDDRPRKHALSRCKGDGHVNDMRNSGCASAIPIYV
jgi:2,3-diketo-5-methylthio-1-phosphopentane phosphatase